jgi:hypothetical protein
MQTTLRSGVLALTNQHLAAILQQPHFVQRSPALFSSLNLTFPLHASSPSSPSPSPSSPVSTESVSAQAHSNPVRPARPKIAVDIDEVLGSFLSTLNSFCLQKYGMKYDIRDYHVYTYHQVMRDTRGKSPPPFNHLFIFADLEMYSRALIRDSARFL